MKFPLDTGRVGSLPRPEASKSRLKLITTDSHGRTRKDVGATGYPNDLRLFDFAPSLGLRLCGGSRSVLLLGGRPNLRVWRHSSTSDRSDDVVRRVCRENDAAGVPTAAHPALRDRILPAASEGAESSRNAATRDRMIPVR